MSNYLFLTYFSGICSLFVVIFYYCQQFAYDQSTEQNDHLLTLVNHVAKAQTYERIPLSRSHIQKAFWKSYENAQKLRFMGVSNKHTEITLLIPIRQCHQADQVKRAILHSNYNSTQRFFVILFKYSQPTDSLQDIRECISNNVVIITDNWYSWHKHLLSLITTDYVMIMTQPPYSADEYHHFPGLQTLVQILDEKNLNLLGMPDVFLHTHAFELPGNCHQLTLERYQLDIRPNLAQILEIKTRTGQQHKKMWCIPCDHVSSFTQLFRSNYLRKFISRYESMSMNVALLWMSVSEKMQTKSLSNMQIVCLDTENKRLTRYHQIHAAASPAALTRRKLMPIARAFDFARISVMSESSAGPMTTTYDYLYDELKIGCKKEKGYILSKICYDDLLTGMHHLNDYVRKLGTLLSVNAGNVFGAMKFAGILPWERDADADIPYNMRNAFKRDFGMLVKVNSVYKFTDEPYCPKLPDGSYKKCGRHYFDFYLRNWRIQLNAESTLFQSSKGNLSNPTRARIGEDWFVIATNPNFYLRNYYSGQIYQHIEHYSEYQGMSTKNYKNMKIGQFIECNHEYKEYHGCLKNYFVEGNIQFDGLTI